MRTEVIELTIDAQSATNISQGTARPIRAPSSPGSIYSITSSPSIPLQQTRIGTVLTSAAIIDDVVGLVIAALIPALADLQSSSSSHSSLAWTLIRPLLSSLLIALLTPLVARFVLRPVFRFRGLGERWCAPRRVDKPWGWRLSGAEWGTGAHADFVKASAMVCVLSAFVTISYCEPWICFQTGNLPNIEKTQEVAFCLERTWRESLYPTSHKYLSRIPLKGNSPLNLTFGRKHFPLN